MITAISSSPLTALLPILLGPRLVIQQRHVALSRDWWSIRPGAHIGSMPRLEALPLTIFIEALIWAQTGLQLRVQAQQQPFRKCRFAHLRFIRICPIYSMSALKLAFSFPRMRVSRG